MVAMFVVGLLGIYKLNCELLLYISAFTPWGDPFKSNARMTTLSVFTFYFVFLPHF